ncbi:MAG: UDP-2,4-diacetamido-2,4,6-trideoxy-beta-L-altropyranose hydrolase [Candidatus Sulfotelmatobacter sp.]
MADGILLIRADANIAMGTGHVMRCLALAQAWQDAGGRAVFAMAETTPSLERRMADERAGIKRIAAIPASASDAQETVNIAKRIEADWIVVDGYHFGEHYQSVIKASDCRLLFVDDNGHAAHYSADLVLNQNLHAVESLYSNRESYTRLLLGPSYTMLRREFGMWRKWKREIRETGTRILIVMGGSDPGNLTSLVIEALESVQQFRLELLAVVGGSNPHLAQVDAAVSGSRHSIRLVKDAANMAELMAWADMAISAAGSICWEFCALALPALLIPVAPNQLASAEKLESVGVVKVFADGRQFRPEEFCREEFAREMVNLITSPSERQRLSEESRSLVDGRGAGRVVSALCGQAADRRKED